MLGTLLVLSMEYCTVVFYGKMENLLMKEKLNPPSCLLVMLLNQTYEYFIQESNGNIARI